MAKSRSGARTRAGAPPKLDDLTVIEGIGAARSEWLRAELGVQTYADLAAMPPDDVVAALKAAGQVASANVAGGWIARARELAGPVEPADWAPLASFVVEFQGHEATGALRTVVHHVEADESETWLGVEAGRASDWMLERAPEPAAGEAAGAAGEAASGPAAMAGTAAPDAPPSPAVGARIGPVRLLRDGEADAAPSSGRAFSRLLRGDEPFAIEVPLEHETAGAFRVRLYAEDLATARRIHLGDGTPERVDGPQSPYVAVIADCTLPEGVYRLSVLAYTPAHPPRPAEAALEAPLLRVG